MSGHFIVEDYQTLKSDWLQQLQQQQQQLNAIPNLLNTLLEKLWLDSENIMDLMISKNEPLSLSVMQGYFFEQMKTILCTHKQLYTLLEKEDEPIEYSIPSSTASSESIASELSSDLGSTPLLTSYLSTSTTEISSITQNQENTKKEEENDILEQSQPRPLKLSPSPSTPALGKTASCCESNFIPACNYLCYYPKNNVRSSACHFCSELITPLKKSFSMDDLSNNRQLDDDSSSYYTSDESTLNKVEEFQPLIHKEDELVHSMDEDNEYKHLSSFTKQSNDSLDSIILKHQEIISTQLEKKKDRRSMFNLFSNKKISRFFTLKKKKASPFNPKKDISVFI